MSEEQKKYRQVFKATSLFGGVKVFQIIISIVKSKVVAILLGTYGMGILGLFTTSLNLISEIAGLGLDRSSVKDISLANANKNKKKSVWVITLLNKLLWITGIGGAILTLFLSPLLSRWVFDSPNFTYGFWWIALALLFKQLAIGNLAILQGLRKLKTIAQANLIGSLLSLFVVLPFYYFLGVKAIAPTMAITFIISFFINWNFVRRLKIHQKAIDFKTAITEGKPMMRLGVTMSISSLLVMLSTFIIQLYISNTGNINQVGFYHAGMLVINAYVGVVFNAMGTDYYPRLAAVANNIKELRKTVLHQAHIAILLITPIIVLFLMVEEFAVTLLYSTKFLPIVPFLAWAILGTLFKAVSFSMGYIFIAKGDSKLFLKTSLLFNSILLALNMAGYYWGGIEGLGISFFVYYVIHLILVGIITKMQYNFYFHKGFYKVFLVCIALCGITFSINYFYEDNLKYIALGLLLLTAVGFSFYKLQKEMNFIDIIKEYFNKKKK